MSPCEPPSCGPGDLIMTLLDASPAAALTYLVNRALDTCGGTPVTAAANVTANGTPDDPVGIDN